VSFVLPFSLIRTHKSVLYSHGNAASRAQSSRASLLRAFSATTYGACDEGLNFVIYDYRFIQFPSSCKEIDLLKIRRHTHHFLFWKQWFCRFFVFKIFPSIWRGSDQGCAYRMGLYGGFWGESSKHQHHRSESWYWGLCRTSPSSNYGGEGYTELAMFDRTVYKHRGTIESAPT
jgi:hypothetical protein